MIGLVPSMFGRHVMIRRLVDYALDRVIASCARSLDAFRRPPGVSASVSRERLRVVRNTRDRADLAIGQYLADLWNV